MTNEAHENKGMHYKDAELFVESLQLKDLDLSGKLMIVLSREFYADETFRQQTFDRLPEIYQIICNWALDPSNGHCSHEDNICYAKSMIRNLKKARRAMKIMHNKELAGKNKGVNKTYKIKPFTPSK